VLHENIYYASYTLNSLYPFITMLNGIKVSSGAVKVRYPKTLHE